MDSLLVETLHMLQQLEMEMSSLLFRDELESVQTLVFALKLLNEAALPLDEMEASLYQITTVLASNGAEERLGGRAELELTRWRETIALLERLFASTDASLVQVRGLFTNEYSPARRLVGGHVLVQPEVVLRDVDRIQQRQANVVQMMMEVRSVLTDWEALASLGGKVQAMNLAKPF